MSLNCKRATENVFQSKRQRVGEEVQTDVHQKIEMVAHILTELNGQFHCKESKAGCKNARDFKSYSNLHLHAIQHNPEVGLVVMGFRCNEHQFDTFNRQSLSAHFVNTHKIKLTDEDCFNLKVRVINREEGWYLCPANTPLFTKRQVIEMYARTHQLSAEDLKSLLNRHSRQLYATYDPNGRNGSLFKIPDNSQ